MPIKTWMEEFYPVTAQEAVETAALTSNNDKRKFDLLLVDHSIKKWEGLTRDNLNRHNCFQDKLYPHIIIAPADGTTFSINTESCALCERYYEDPDGERSECYNCPLNEYLGHPCFGYQNNTPYSQFTTYGNPFPMIEALKGTKQMLLEQPPDPPDSEE